MSHVQTTGPQRSRWLVPGLTVAAVAIIGGLVVPFGHQLLESQPSEKSISYHHVKGHQLDVSGHDYVVSKSFFISSGTIKGHFQVTSRTRAYLVPASLVPKQGAVQESNGFQILDAQDGSEGAIDVHLAGGGKYVLGVSSSGDWNIQIDALP